MGKNWGEGERRANSPRGYGELPTLRVFDENGREVFWAEVGRAMLTEFFLAAQQPGEHVISLHLTTKKKWLIPETPDAFPQEGE